MPPLGPRGVEKGHGAKPAGGHGHGVRARHHGHLRGARAPLGGAQDRRGVGAHVHHDGLVAPGHGHEVGGRVAGLDGLDREGARVDHRHAVAPGIGDVDVARAGLRELEAPGLFDLGRQGHVDRAARVSGLTAAAVAGVQARVEEGRAAPGGGVAPTRDQRARTERRQRDAEPCRSQRSSVHAEGDRRIRSRPAACGFDACCAGALCDSGGKGVPRIHGAGMRATGVR